MNIMVGGVSKQILLAQFLVANGAERIKRLTHQPKELVNKNNDINEWKPRTFF